MATRTVEYFRCWEDHTWDTDFIEIPADTPEDKIEDAVREASNNIDWKDEPPCFVGLYCIMDDEQPTRQELMDKFWANIDPSLRGYSNAIQRLLDMLTDEQLQSVVPEDEDEDEEEDDE